MTHPIADRSLTNMFSFSRIHAGHVFTLVKCGVLGLLGFLLVAAGDAPAPQPAAVSKVLDLFDRLRAGKKIGFQLTEAEVNEYMVSALKRQPRPGLESTRIRFFPKNYVATYTVVDFDAVEKWKPGTIPALLRPVLTGRKTVWIDVRFQVTGSRLTYTVEKAYFENIWLPASLVQKMIEVVAARQPEHYDTTKPLPLPFGLRDVRSSDKLVAGNN